ncbi:hypothetical protein C7B62_23770 [Pleurocapsa sp. CCALA 161]|uniref:hypothetical protein n=1 Tax=Pleurocapsa sp. CCALA 161 TaxID=2107688 RepID=UPI000D068970|nr:hypothetical protein [Pleurocapsa sp. CCALA 161]PSB06070.1 hypothetical protein C7B62_23770 [Pleurocapsa sp. CCALA 161]
MINKSNFVYSKSAAARILNVKPYEIVRFEVWYKVCFVKVKGQRPTFISKKAFKQHFVDWRIEQSRSLCTAQVNQEHFRVINPRKSTAYSVYLFEDGLDCECEDYKNQVLIFNGKACCKHNYAVLTWLGYNRLKDYIIANARAA